MHQFFVPLSGIGEESITITGSDVHHIRDVIRLQEGEKIALLDGRGARYFCRIDVMEKEKIEALIEKKESVEEELSSKLYLFQGMPKSDKMELIVQKAVELGCYQVIPVITERTIVKWNDKQAEKKVARYQSISESAAKQSSRGMIPEIKKPLRFSKALEEAKQLDHILFPYELAENMEATRNVLSHIRPGESVGIFIGPEGGFSEKEVQEALSSGAHVITLGRRILRTETAGLATLSMLLYVLEE